MDGPVNASVRVTWKWNRTSVMVRISA